MADTIANQNPDPAKVIARTGECMRRLMEVGVTYEDLQKPIDSPLFRQRLARLWHDGTTKFSGVSVEEANRLCNGNYIDVTEGRRYFRFAVPPGQDLYSNPIPFNRYELEEKGKNHVLVWDPGLSLFQLMGLVPQYFKGGYIEPGPHLEEQGTPGWHLVRIGAVPYTSNKVWDAQKGRLGEEERVPSARLVVYAGLVHRLSYRGKPSFIGERVRTATLDREGAPLGVMWEEKESQPLIALEKCRKGSLFGFGLASETIPESELFQ